MSGPSNTVSNGSGQDARGRFVAGNKCSRGARAHRSAELRRAFLEVVTPEKMKAIAARLVALAESSFVPVMMPAAKLVLAYALGKPRQADEPGDDEQDGEGNAEIPSHERLSLD